MDNGLCGIGGEIFSDMTDSVEMVIGGFADVGDMGGKGHCGVTCDTQVLGSSRGEDLVGTNSYSDRGDGFERVTGKE